MLTLAAFVLFCATATAFSPSSCGGHLSAAPKGVCRHGSTMSLDASLNRRALFSSAAAAVFVLPQLANADGATSKATKERAIGIYGQRILALEKAVAAGDTAAVAAEKNAFILYSSAGFAGNSKAQKPIKSLVVKVNSAAAAGDAAAVKTAYAELLKEGAFIRLGTNGRVDYNVYDMSSKRNLGSPTPDFMPDQYLTY